MLASRGMTLLELIVVMLIVGIATAIGMRSFGTSADKTKANEAYARAQTIWQAEKRKFAFSGTYATDWPSLNMSDPNIDDKVYNYEITVGAVDMTPTFCLKVSKKSDPDIGFSLNNKGVRSETPRSCAQ